MATRDLKSLVRKNTEAAAVASTVKAEEDRKAHQAKAPTPAPAPVAPVSDAAQAAFRAQATANLTKKPVVGALDTIEPVDPSGVRIVVTTRMPGATHKAYTVKMDVRQIALIEQVTKKQNVAAYVSHVLAVGTATILREMQAKGTTTYHEHYESSDRNTFCGVPDPLLLACIAYIEKNQNQE